MFDNLFRVGDWPAKAKGVCVSFAVGAPYADDKSDLARGIAGRNDNPEKTFAPELKRPLKERVMKVTKMMCAFAMNMEAWSYPACKHYYTIDKSEAAAGYTKDFGTKHISSTKDNKSTKKVAETRGKPVNQRQGIQAFGNIVTSRSGGLVKEDLVAFCKEIKQRQPEFTETYVELSNYFASNCENMHAGGNANFDVLFDNITFITNRSYRMFEYVDGKGGEENVFIHFGVSCTADGKEWAVHHLARTSADRVLAGGNVAANIFGAPDALTSVRNPL